MADIKNELLSLTRAEDGTVCAKMNVPGSADNVSPPEEETKDEKIKKLQVQLGSEHDEDKKKELEQQIDSLAMNGGRKSRKSKKKGGKRSSLNKSKKGAKKSRGGKSQSQQNQQQGGALEFSTFGKESHIETGADKSTSVAGSLDGGLHPVVPRINGGGLFGLVKGGSKMQPMMGGKHPMNGGGCGAQRSLMNGGGAQKPLMNGGSGCSIAANPQMGGRRRRKGGQKDQQQGGDLAFSEYKSKGGQKDQNQHGGEPLGFSEYKVKGGSALGSSPYSSKGGKRRTKGKGTTKGKRGSAKK